MPSLSKKMMVNGLPKAANRFVAETNFLSISFPSIVQVNNRQKNKGKADAPAVNTQESAPAPKKAAAAEKRSANAAPAVSNKNDSDAETSAPSSTVAAAPQPIETIEICQLLPSGENPYTASDDWWKQALNKQQTFSVDDIVEWPERDQDEQYVVNVKRIVATKATKPALTEKDINVNIDGHDEVRRSSQRIISHSRLNF